MENTEETWGVIVNPYAGTRRLRKDWIEIYQIMKRANIHFKHELTEYPTHATDIARSMLEKGCRHLLIVGGDGTLNEVVNGIYTSNITDKQKVTIALIPYGTGNDWGRFWGLKSKDKSIASRLSARHTQKVDIGKVTTCIDGQCKEYYFLNGFGAGFDGYVVHLTDDLKKVLGGSSWVYKLSVLLAVFGYKSKKMTLSSPDKTVQKSIYTIAVGNGCYSGGGLKQTPKAVPTDGLFHITAIEHPNLWKILIGLRQLITDELDKHPMAHTFVTNHFEIDSTNNLMVEIDGVMLPMGNKYTVETIPSALNMMV